MGERKDRKGLVVIVSGPSGVGKSTICKEIAKRLKDVYLSVSVTTRPKSPAEIGGRDYWFISEAEFQERLNNDGFLEHARVFDNLYGTPKDKVEEALQAGKIAILEIDVQGAKQVKAIYPDSIMIFILPPTQNVLEKRMHHRARDDSEAEKERLGEASSEIAAGWQYYDNMVINEDLKQAANECIQIIQSAGRKKIKSKMEEF